MIKQIKKYLTSEINKILGKNIITVDDFEYPPLSKMGDLAVPCFSIAKIQKKSPIEIVKEIKDKIKVNNIVSKVEAQGAYLNFFIKAEYLIKNTIELIEKEKVKYGINKNDNPKRIVIEFSNVNTHKEYHVGHLRNICYGDAVSKILSVNGNEIIPISYVNDFGIHVAKTLWNFDAFLEEHYANQNIDNKKGFILGKMYVDASIKSKNNKMAKEEIGSLMKKIESKSGREYELWKKTRAWSIEQFDKIYKDLNVTFKDFFYESDLIENGLKEVKKLLNKGVLEKSNGAVIANLENENLGVLVFLRSDGTATYPVADLALAQVKDEKYHADKSIYIVDNRQSLYFKQLFKILEKAGLKGERIHLAYDFVKLKSGMMSSRSGNVITYEELKIKMEEICQNEIKARHSDWSSEKIKEVSAKIGLGAIKFEMIKVNTDSVITFDLVDALDYSGFTSTYIQYAHVRIQSILRKISKNGNDINLSNLKESKEYNIVLKLSKYPEIVKMAGDKYNPSIVAKYLYELAKQFNDYYHNVNIAKAKPEIQVARIALIESVGQVIENGLRLLGIDCLEEM